jgi:glycosyltransferase involved in cell wall biosynthesis
MTKVPQSLLMVTMSFPAPSEAFAGVEVRALRRLGLAVHVASLRPPHRLANELLQDWELRDVDISHWTWRTLYRATGFSLRHPWITLATFGWLVRHGWRRPTSLTRGLLLLPRCLEAFASCLRLRPDVLHLFWGHYPATVGYMTLRWLPRTRVSTALGAYDLLLEYGPGLDVARRAHSVWTQAECNRASLLAAGVPAERVHVLVRGVDVNQVGEAPAKRGDAPVVVIARLEANKGVDDALRAFAQGTKRHDQVRLQIVGEGPQEATLRVLARVLGIEGRVDFLGAVSHTRVFDLLKEAGTFLLLSRNPSERLPNALKEAMACRCVCIVTRTPGLEELAVAWHRPCIVEQGQWSAAAQRLQEVLERPDLWESDRDAGRAHVMRRMDADEVARLRLANWSMDGVSPLCAA